MQVTWKPALLSARERGLWNALARRHKTRYAIKIQVNRVEHSWPLLFLNREDAEFACTVLPLFRNLPPGKHSAHVAMVRL
jgi:hypothetical protein